LFHDIAELRKAGDGYVFWRDVCVEHYSYPDSEEGQAREREAAHRLADRCRAIEARGEVVSWGAVLRDGTWDGVTAPQPIRDLAVALCARYGLNGVCDPGYVANLIHAEQTAEDPYYAVPEWGGAIFARRADAVPGGSVSSRGFGLTLEELNATDDRPWRGACATSGATMRDFADALAAVAAPAWVKRAAVALCRSYASNIDWRRDARDVATAIAAAVAEGSP
jgi:hypothetical protein